MKVEALMNVFSFGSKNQSFLHCRLVGWSLTLWANIKENQSGKKESIITLVIHIMLWMQGGSVLNISHDRINSVEKIYDIHTTRSNVFFCLVHGHITQIKAKCNSTPCSVYWDYCSFINTQITVTEAKHLETAWKMKKPYMLPGECHLTELVHSLLNI